jgi:hypothetical protein
MWIANGNTFRNGKGGRCLDAADPNNLPTLPNGTLVGLWDCHDGVNQHWSLAPAYGCPIQPYGDIGAAWRAMGNPNPLGCALEVETGGPDGYGRSQRFEHGQITWSSPSHGTHALLVAYQAGNTIELQWTGLEPYNYDFWIVRTDKNGQNIGQTDVKGERSAGWYVSRNISFEGAYSFVVEGCDEVGILGEGGVARCRQGWLNRVTINVVPNPIKASPTLPDPPARGQGCFVTPSCVFDLASKAISVGGTIIKLF